MVNFKSIFLFNHFQNTIVSSNLNESGWHKVHCFDSTKFSNSNYCNYGNLNSERILIKLDCHCRVEVGKQNVLDKHEWKQFRTHVIIVKCSTMGFLNILKFKIPMLMYVVKKKINKWTSQKKTCQGICFDWTFKTLKDWDYEIPVRCLCLCWSSFFFRNWL